VSDIENIFKAALVGIDRLEPRVKNMIYSYLSSELIGIAFDLDRCESPIEQMMHIELNHRLRSCHFRVPVYLKNQAEITTSEGKYRVDFLISIQIPPRNENNFKYIVVECDGHDFHERTKEQAKRDKSRDRDLQANGYIVMRFTGSEIWHSPLQCVSEVMRMIRRIEFEAMGGATGGRMDQAASQDPEQRHVSESEQQASGRDDNAPADGEPQNEAMGT